MRRQRLRAGQAHSVCAFCASRLARDATRLLPYSPSPLQIRESSRLERLAHVAVESDSQPSAEGNRHPASTHASPLNISTTSNAQSEKQDAPKSSAEDAADDLSFMDAEGVGRASTAPSQQPQSEQSQPSANSTHPNLSQLNSRGAQGDPRPGNGTHTRQGHQQAYASPPPLASTDAEIRRAPNFRIRFNRATDPPKGSRLNAERTSTWSHLNPGQPRHQNRQHGGQGSVNASRRSRDRDSQPDWFVNGLRSVPAGQKSSAYDSQEFSSILTRLGSKSLQQKQANSARSTAAPKSYAPAHPALFGSGNSSVMSFADYNRKSFDELSTKRANIAQQTESRPKEPIDKSDFTRPTAAAQQTPAMTDSNPALNEDHHDLSEDFDFTGTTSASRQTSRFQQNPDVPVANINAPEKKEEYHDPSDDFDFTGAVPSARATATPQKVSAPPETQPTAADETDEFDFTAPQPAPRRSLAAEQKPPPVTDSASRDSVPEPVEELDFTEPQSTSQLGRTRLSRLVETNPPKDAGAMTASAAAFFQDVDPTSSQQGSTSKSTGEETWAEAAARRAAKEALAPAEQPYSIPKRPAWRLPSEEPQRKSSRSSRFAQDEDEVDDGRRKRKDKKSFKASDEDFDLEGGMKAEAKAERKAKKRQEREAKKAEAVDKPTPLYLPEYITVSNFANMLKVRAEALLKKMEEFGYEDVRPDDILNAENAGLIASEYNFEPIPPLPEDMDLYPTPEPEDKSVLPLRPPVVTIMGHVDHGKTTLLDFLRKSSVVASEFGGITQHIGAFNVPLSSGKTITFLDTPGHAAFLNMRQRGANVTDIVILVVAADDGVKAQTEEAIKHAQSAGVPMIVAINKIDKEGAEIQRVKQDLARHDIYVEDFGGDIQAIPVSGKTGQGMQDLEEATSLLSEILDHRADPTGPVEGHIIEASTKERGRVATLLIRRGTLKVGDIIVAGTTFARVRTMRNEAGVEVESVGPGMPAEIDGWRGQPEAGDEFLEAPNEQRANEAIEYRTVTRERIKLAKDMEAIAEARRQEHEKREKEARRQEQIAKAIKAKIENPEKYVADMEKAAEEGEEKKKREEVSLILKADVSGSEEACRDYIMTVGNNEVRPKIARSGVGTVSEFDIEFASAVKGYIVAFNVEIPQHIRRLASYHGVKFIENNVIYRLVDDIKKVLEERLPPLITHKITGELKILQEFDINIKGRKKVRVAGCRVENGMIERNSKVKVLRRNEVIYQGTLSSLKHEKRDVTEMRKDTECGLGFDGWSDFREGDTIQVYEEISNKRHL